MLRFRVFAGPNGSGKSTIIKSVKEDIVNGQAIDFGAYVNADDIAIALSRGNFSFADYGLEFFGNEVFQTVVLQSGLVDDAFPVHDFMKSYRMVNNTLVITDGRYIDRLAQIMANFLIKKLIGDEKKCSLETVFSHRSKVEIMKDALGRGYKVYLYFVATNDPEINVERVRSRASQGGHDVPIDRIIARYYRSLDLLYEAAQIAYQCYFFDNSATEYKLIAHFKMEHGSRVWDAIEPNDLPGWFIQYYVNKQSQ